MLEFSLSLLFYVILVRALVVASDFLGLGRNIFVFLFVYGFSFVFVYAFVGVAVGCLFSRLNDNVRILRRAHGGPDIAAEGRHEGEADLISLFPDE